MKGSSYIMMVVVVVVVVVVSLLNCYVECEGCLEEGRSLLLQLKSSFNLSNEDSLAWSDWKGQNCCEWVGVYCSNTSRVFELLLYDVRVLSADTIWYPKESVKILAQFKELQYLVMSSTGMGGSDILEAFCKLQYLKSLRLSSTSLEGKIPHCIRKMHSLQVLDLSNNQLQGNIPLSTFSDMHFLQELDLSGNELQGIISPFTFSNMHFLHELDLSGNQLQGIISPFTFSNMHSLQKLDLSGNQLQGTVSPSTFNNLTMVTDLSLSNNHFVGTIPFSMFANLSKLTSLDLSNNYQLEVETESPNWVPHFQLTNLNLANCQLNRLSGSIVPSFLSTQYTLESLDLSNSSLAGDIPSYLLYNSTQYLMLQGNSLSGPYPLPHQNTTSSLRSLDISNNLVYGSLPENFVDLFPILNYCDMSANALQGNLPPTMGVEVLQWLFLSDNNFSGEMPPGLIKSFNLRYYLVLSNNRLQGEMLPGNVSMEGLVCLKLDGNENNHLSGNISSWLPVHLRLTVLLVRGNHFEGSIPSHICQMVSLHILDLSYNSLGGAVPSCLASVPSWKSRLLGINPGFDRTTVDLITKGLSYSYTGLPAQWMTLIDLSTNKLTGAIPFEMGNMTWLRALNLRNPQEITKLSFLNTFNVAFNNLSGEIPSQGHFLTFTNSSYEGNQRLCGTPLTVDCSSNNPKRPNENGKVEEKEENGILDGDLFFYSCMAISYCLGFWASIGLLFFSSWRKKFYMTMDAFQDWCFWKLWRMILRLKRDRRTRRSAGDLKECHIDQSRACKDSRSSSPEDVFAESKDSELQIQSPSQQKIRVRDLSRSQVGHRSRQFGQCCRHQSKVGRLSPTACRNRGFGFAKIDQRCDFISEGVAVAQHPYLEAKKERREQRRPPVAIARSESAEEDQVETNRADHTKGGANLCGSTRNRRTCSPEKETWSQAIPDWIWNPKVGRTLDQEKKTKIKLSL
ncbi:LRR receptor-like serine/threonine-protein kinase ERECTA [Cinnamomum micranthum f. kanehirae]|uniref:LRR receptor-like serine/threonine-protein kinase ERECTA n=1 Tax=Cinnamomum micranthum f. kanehirae TaxID=337451 RepID=A0A3S3Q1D9_9MAGN|nr:LRR receptor-like serine/threonine-protein kinase ERECTA [Cinnamomum micranthum f. kanehirae]